MTFRVHHTGLTFTDRAIETARQQRQQAPFDAAFKALESLSSTEPVAQAVIDGFRWRFNADADAAHKAAASINAFLHQPSFPPGIPFDQATAMMLAAGQAVELLRDTYNDATLAAVLRQYRTQIDAIWQAKPTALIGETWQMTAAVVGGVVLEDETLFGAGLDGVKRIVREEIHPEGYLPRLVERSTGGALARQVSAAQALTLAAEVAQHVGGTLWQYESRGVSVKTAAIYAAAYYEYPHTWPWDTPLSEAETAAFYAQAGGFFEMLNRQLRPEILKTTLDQLRPVFSPYSGGLVTLSHGTPAPKRRRLFGL